METPENKGIIYEFGKFVLDPGERTLFSDGVPLHLPAKEFDTLVLLVEHNGQALTKEEMMRAIWEDAFVEESNLSKQISRLRKIFNTKSEEYIQTLPKHGYRFSADLSRTFRELDDQRVLAKRTVSRVTFASENDAASTPAPLYLPTPSYFSVNWRTMIGIGIAAVAGLAAFWYWGQRTESGKARIETIAVLPLRSLSPGDDNKTIGLGLADSLITKLGSIKQLVVRPIGSVATFADSEEDSLEIGRKLKVDAVLDGSILESNGRLRINARLISTATGEQIWSQKFDDNVTTIFEVEDHISEQTARALTATLTGDSGKRLTKQYTENPAAFDAYVKGRYYWNKRNEADFRRAIGYFDQAVALDPNYALAYAGLADCYILLAVWGTEPPNISLPKAKDAALKALSADSELAEAHTSLAFIKWVFDWDFEGAGEEFDLATKLNPNYATAHHWRSYYLVSVERNDEAIAAIKRAQELEGPLSVGIMTDVGEIYCWAGQYDKAIENLSNVASIEPGYAIAHLSLGITYIKKGLAGEAMAELEKAKELENSPRVEAALGFAYGQAGQMQKARQILSELEEISRKRYVSPFSMAIANVGVGEDEAAIDWLEKARAERSDAMAILKVYPLLEKLHANPRFIKLTEEIGYQE